MAPINKMTDEELTYYFHFFNDTWIAVIEIGLCLPELMK